MADMILVCGANSSGKSKFAEKLVSKTCGKRYYIATLQPAGEYDNVRIEKHRKQRENLSFETLELPYGFKDIELEENSVVLLEDAANLLGNLIFGKQQGIKEALAEIESLKTKCKTLILVGISGYSAEGYEGETADYVNQMNELNSVLFDKSTAVVEMENGEAKIRKGEKLLYDEGFLDSPVNL